MASLMNRTQARLIAAQVEEAKGFFQRLRGLLGRASLAESSALWLDPCNSIHTYFMQFAIDAIFVNRELVVLSVFRNVQPGRIIAPIPGARSVFEMTAGSVTSDTVKEGDQLYVGS